MNTMNRIYTRCLKMFPFAGRGRHYYVKSSCVMMSSTPDDVSLDRLFRFKSIILKDEDSYDDRNEGIPEKIEFGDDEPKSSVQLGKQLLTLGKIHYRRIEQSSEWIQKKQQEISSNRTSPQIRRWLKNWMILYDRELQVEYRNRPLGWKGDGLKSETKTAIAYGPEDTVAYTHYFMPARLAVMKRVFRELKTILPNFSPTRMLDFGCGPGTAFAAVIDTWGTETEKAKDSGRVTVGSQDKASDWISRIETKVGMGGGVKKYAGIDISQNMLEAARILCKDLSVDAFFWDRTGDVLQVARSRGDRFDLIVAAYTLTELTSDSARRAATQALYELLDVGGCLVILEQGNPYGSHTVRTARQFVLSSMNQDTVESKKSKNEEKQEDVKSTSSSKAQPRGQSSVERFNLVLPLPPTAVSMFGVTDMEQLAARVIAPCTHDKECPLGQGVWCSFAQKAHSGMIRQGSEEKFSYVILRKEISNSLCSQVNNTQTEGYSGLDKRSDVLENWTNPFPVDDADADPTPLSLLRRFAAIDKDYRRNIDHERVRDNERNLLPFQRREQLLEEIENEIDWDYNPPLHRREWSRVIRPPMKAKGHITLDLCTPSGTLTRHALSRPSVSVVPSMFTILQKTTWGGLFPAFEMLQATKRPAIASAYTDDKEAVRAPSKRRVDGGTHYATTEKAASGDFHSKGGKGDQEYDALSSIAKSRLSDEVSTHGKTAAPALDRVKKGSIPAAVNMGSLPGRQRLPGKDNDDDVPVLPNDKSASRAVARSALGRLVKKISVDRVGKK